MAPAQCANIHPPLSGPTCAVVGSAVQHTAYGGLIDTHERVWRVNDAPTRGFESLVGSTTTDRLINRVSVFVWSGAQFIAYNEMHEAYRPHAFSPELCYNLTCKLVDADLKTLEKLALARRRYPNLRVRVHRGVRQGAQICGSASPRSTGFLAVSMALRRCRAPIALFGFAPDCCNRERYKYYHNNATRWVCCATSREDMNSEVRLYAMLAARGDVWLSGVSAAPPHRQ